ncbi:MAG: cupin domain-containing protein [Verrucomicrobiia bacterium]
MILRNLEAQIPFVTADGSRIRSLLDRSNAPVENQSLAEASLVAGQHTAPHFHRVSEEFYFILEGSGTVMVADEVKQVGVGDAILIPPGTVHTIKAACDLRFLCCCAPPYSHEDTVLVTGTSAQETG